MAERQAGKDNRFRWLWLIPILALAHLTELNLLPFGGTASYFIDVGGNDTGGITGISEPFDGVSGKKELNGTSFRELQRKLVYFEVESHWLEQATDISMSLRFKDELPDDGRFILGASNKQESYDWKEIYVPFYGQVDDLPLVMESGNVKVYATTQKGDTKFQSVDDFLLNPPQGSVIARNDRGLTVNQWEESGPGKFRFPGNWFPFTEGKLPFPPFPFLHKRCEVIDLKYDLSWVKKSADYIVVNFKDYVPPAEDDGWLVAHASWKGEGLLVSNNGLDFCLSTPHLDKNPDRAIPVDWIKIKLKVLPIWER